jgi:hypothetical protein
MGQPRDDTQLLCVTNTVSPAVLLTLCLQFVFQTQCWRFCGQT